MSTPCLKPFVMKEVTTGGIWFDGHFLGGSMPWRISIKIWMISEDIWIILIVSRAHWTICWRGPNFDGFRCQTVSPWIGVYPACQEKDLWLRKDVFCLFLSVFRWMIDRYVALKEPLAVRFVGWLLHRPPLTLEFSCWMHARGSSVLCDPSMTRFPSVFFPFVSIGVEHGMHLSPVFSTPLIKIFKVSRRWMRI